MSENEQQTPVTPADRYAPGSGRSTAEKLEDLRRRTEESLDPGSARAREKRDAAGHTTPRQRIDALLDPGTFTEIGALSGDRGARGLLARHAAHLAAVPVTEDSVLRDFDTPEALARLDAPA